MAQCGLKACNRGARHNRQDLRALRDTTRKTGKQPGKALWLDSEHDEVGPLEYFQVVFKHLDTVFP